MKKNKNSPDEIVLPGKAKLNTIEVLISKYLVFSVNNVLSRYTEMKEEIKTSVEHTFVNIVDICRKTYERNDIEKIVGTGAILWLNEKHIVEGLDHKNM